MQWQLSIAVDRHQFPRQPVQLKCSVGGHQEPVNHRDVETRERLVIAGGVGIRRADGFVVRRDALSQQRERGDSTMCMHVPEPRAQVRLVGPFRLRQCLLGQRSCDPLSLGHLAPTKKASMANHRGRSCCVGDSPLGNACSGTVPD